MIQDIVAISMVLAALPIGWAIGIALYNIIHPKSLKERLGMDDDEFDTYGAGNPAVAKEVARIRDLTNAGGNTPEAIFDYQVKMHFSGEEWLGWLRYQKKMQNKELEERLGGGAGEMIPDLDEARHGIFFISSAQFDDLKKDKNWAEVKSGERRMYTLCSEVPVFLKRKLILDGGNL